MYIMHKKKENNCAKKRNVEGMLTLVYKNDIVQVWKSFAVWVYGHYIKDKGEMCHEIIISLVWRGR